MCITKGVGRKISRREGAKENPRARNSTNNISLPVLYHQWWLRGRTEHIPRAMDHFKGTLRQEPRVKMKSFFWRNTHHFRENAYLFEKILGYFRVLRPPLVFNQICLLTSATQQRTKMVGGSWDVFTKRVLVEKHINGIMYKNPGGHNPCSSLPTPTFHKN